MTAFKGMRALLLCSAAIAAGSATAQEVVDLAPIVVDSKRDVATDSANATTTVDSTEIEDRQGGTIAELVDSVPGVNLVNGGTPVGSGISIRGLGANGTYGSDQKVGIQVGNSSKGSEEIYRVGNQLFTDPALYNSVQVFRGPGGTFQYGSGLIGGLVRAEPSFAPDVFGEEAGWKVRQLLQFSTNGDGIASSSTLGYQADGFEMLANFTWREEGITVDGAGNDRTENGIGLPSWMVTGRYSFGSADEHRLSVILQETSTDEQDVPYDTFATSAGIFGNVNRQTTDRTAELRYEYDSPTTDMVNLMVSLSYSDQEIMQEAVGIPISPVLDADHRYETTKLLLKNTAFFDTSWAAHELTAGVELSNRKRLDAASAPGGTDKRLAVFLVDEMDFRNGLTVTPELRWESQKLTGSDVDFEGEMDALVGGVSARYAFGNGFSVFGGAYYNESLPVLDDLADATFRAQSEKGRTFELGLGYDGANLLRSGDALEVKAVAYRTHLSDITTIFGVTDARYEGVEIEAAYSMESGFYVDASANIAYGYDETPGAASDILGGIPAKELRVTFGKRWGEELDLSWEVVAAARQDRDSQPTPGYAVHNLRATYRPQQGALEGMEVRFGIENVGDRLYTPNLATYAAPGRNVKLTLSKVF
ncbi:TonB-dependent receptor domain-containing protein [Vannielia litorea]|uniref:TonB-dependent receptor domain-containing protein n=1 Tax=Vannielia litorea TaxID=1217970 RepID=UPI001BCA97B2|nr:TonB-dependent receptor [Vannielia litorea]MBS8227036.1 ligand-gated channel [Vannielia litorea]